MMVLWRRTKLAGLLFLALAAIFYSCVNAGGMLKRRNPVYGDIVSRTEHLIKGAIVEKIALYPQKTERSRDRIMRNAVLVRRPNAKGTVLISNGFMCTKEDTGFLRSLFPEYNCMTFDMRAHGEDTEGQFCTLGRDEALDVANAARFLRNHPDLTGEPLLLYGFSMGAVAAIEAQSKDSTLFDGMILDCPFDASESVVKTSLDLLKFSVFGYEFSIPGRSLLEKYVFHPYVQSLVKVVLKAIAKMDTRSVNTFVYPVFPAESVKKITVPIFLIHCKNDEKVPVEAIQRVYKNAGSSYKKLWITNGRQHYDSYFFNPELYSRRVRKFAKLLMCNELSLLQKEKIIKDGEPASIAVHINVGSIEKRR